MEFFEQLLFPDFMPHGYCYLWNAKMVWLHVISDGLITFSYYCIPVVLVHFIRKNRDLPFSRIFWMFGAFIVACGTTHLMEIWNVWHGSYLLGGVIKAITAAVSVATAVMLVPFVPRVISLPGRMNLQEVNRKLEQEIAERERAQEEREWLAAMIRSSDDAIISKTVDGTITSWNAGAEKLFGYSSLEAIGKPMVMLLPKDRASEESAILTRIRGGERVDHFETTRVRKDGTNILVSVTISPIKDIRGVIVGASKIARDITERKGTQEALRQSDATRRFALETAKVGDWELDLTTLQSTRSLLHDQIFGYRSLLPEWNFDIFLRHVHADERERVREGFQSCASQGKKWEFECRIVHPDGEIRWIWACGDHYRDSSGQATRMFGIVQDITKRKLAGEALAEQALKLSRQAEELACSRLALEDQTLMLRSVLDSMAEGLVAGDEGGKFVLWNPAAEKILGMGAANLPPSKWSEHYGLFLADTVTPFPSDQLPLVRAIRGEASTTEMFVRNGERAEGAWIEATGGPRKNKNGVVCGGVVAFRDITQRKADERQIREFNDVLEHRVVERTAQLETANQELEAFSYSVSHDLRAPLRHISGFSKLLVEEFGNALDPGAQHYLDRICSGIQEMGVLIDELLNLARVGRYALTRQRTRLNPIVAEVVAMLQPESEGRQVKWVIADLPAVECDPVLVKQIFQNLLANAIKFTGPRGVVGGNAGARTRASTLHTVIEVSYQIEDGQLVVMVRDNGVGFNMKYVDKLFGVFQRLHSAAEFEGTGIGLVTVRRIVQKHGGRVWAEGEPDKGAAFYFTLSAGEPV